MGFFKKLFILCYVVLIFRLIIIFSNLFFHKLIKGSQHGFTTGSSCLTNLSEFDEAVSDWVDEGKAVDIVYLDFKKAFDEGPHRRLLAKVRACGVAGQVDNQIANWLRGRK